MVFLSSKVLQAIEFAAVAHDHQYRKFPAKVPYISHLAAVCMVLCKSGYREDVVAAGALHDVLEDTKLTKGEIEKNFGQEVLDLVEAVTEHKNLPWKERKEDYIKRLETATEEAKAISGADLLANRASNLSGLKKGVNPWLKFADNENPKDHAKKIFDIDQKRFEMIKQNTNIPFVPELEAVMREVEELSWKLLEQ